MHLYTARLTVCTCKCIHSYRVTRTQVTGARLRPVALRMLDCTRRSWALPPSQSPSHALLPSAPAPALIPWDVAEQGQGKAQGREIDEQLGVRSGTDSLSSMIDAQVSAIYAEEFQRWSSADWQDVVWHWTPPPSSGGQQLNGVYDAMGDSNR